MSPSHLRATPHTQDADERVEEAGKPFTPRRPSVRSVKKAGARKMKMLMDHHNSISTRAKGSKTEEEAERCLDERISELKSNTRQLQELKEKVRRHTITRFLMSHVHGGN